jgi:hypothetical protein
MRKIVFFAVVILLINCYSFGQVKNSNGINYSQPLQVDSSDYFIIGSLANKTNKLKYNFAPRNQFEGYDGQDAYWTNVFIHSLKDKKLKKLFPNDLVAVYPVQNTMLYIKFDYGYSDPRRMYSGMSSNYIIYLAKTDEYNNDGIIDDDDPVYIYISTKTGENFKRITPRGMNVTRWKMARDGKSIIATIQIDSNNDKKFSDEDEIIYQIDLNDDISKINISTVSM